ncbi:hypothetical protein R50072_03650 [Simiduia litorea]
MMLDYPWVKARAEVDQNIEGDGEAGKAKAKNKYFVQLRRLWQLK